MDQLVFRTIHEAANARVPGAVDVESFERQLLSRF